MQGTKLFYTASEVAKLLDVSVGQAYKLLREWNEDLQKQHYLVIAGKIPIKYFEEKIYGNTNTEKEAANG